MKQYDEPFQAGRCTSPDHDLDCLFICLFMKFTDGKRKAALIRVTRKQQLKGQASKRRWPRPTKAISCCPKWAGQRAKAWENPIRASSSLFRFVFHWLVVLIYGLTRVCWQLPFDMNEYSLNYSTRSFNLWVTAPLRYHLTRLRFTSFFQVGVRSANAGLGTDSSVTKSMDDPEVSQKELARMKAQQRFAKILAQEDS